MAFGNAKPESGRSTTGALRTTEHGASKAKRKARAAHLFGGASIVWQSFPLHPGFARIAEKNKKRRGGASSNNLRATLKTYHNGFLGLSWGFGNIFSK